MTRHDMNLTREQELPPLIIFDQQQLQIFFFNKTSFINKNILEIKTKFISLNQTNF